jgi:hypothetical protein
MEADAVNAIVLQDEIGKDWVRCLHVMADSADALVAYQGQIPAHAKTERRVDDLRLGHIQAKWPLREVVRMLHPNFDGEFFQAAHWMVAVWWIGQEKVSQAMIEAGVAFALATGQDPQYALIRRVPAQAEEFVEVKGICLIRADWVPEGFLVVTTGGMQAGLPAFKVKGRQE